MNYNFLEMVPVNLPYKIVGEYHNSKTKIKVLTEYGECLMFPCNIINSIIPTVASAIDKDKFITNKFNSIHKNRYDYSKINYTGNNKKITVTCNVHGDFEITPHNHISGLGCLGCLKEKRSKIRAIYFVSRSKLIHNDKYLYNDISFADVRTNIDIYCKRHGYFTQSPSAHLQGKGCRKCSEESESCYSRTGFFKASKGRICTFYTLRCWDDEEEFYKIGITSTSISKRYSSKRSMPYKYEIVNKIVSEDPNIIWDIEQKNKKLLKIYSYIPKIKFDGITECYNKNIRNEWS